MVGLDPIALTGRFFSVLAASRRALLRSGGGISLEPRSGDIVEPGARAPGLRLAPWQPSPGGATPGAGMEHRGGWSARRCRPRWGSGKWMIRVVLGLMPQALRSRPASGAQKRLTSNVGRTQHQPGQNITSCSVRDRMNHSAGADYGSLSDLAYDVVGVIVSPVFEMANTV